MTSLVLGPVLRHVDQTTAAVWMETADPARVRIVAGDHVAEGGTFAVHDHHYALLTLTGLEPGSRTPYTVEVEGAQVWPEPGSSYPPSVIRTLDPDRPLRLAYGSCRTSVAHDAAAHRTHGVDALRALALRLAGSQDDWPDLLLHLGDQVYADETTPEMHDFIASRRDLDEPPWTELADYQEYAHLYRLAWSEPAIRWLLSTVPNAMIFDDHDVRDDWNTSWVWRQQMEATDWWHDRIVAALSSYWVHQHLGNLSPAEREADEVWQLVSAHQGPGERDLGPDLDVFAERADQHPDSYRWSYARDFGDQARLVVVDSRAARVLAPDQRSMIDADELRWLDDQLRGDVRHLLVGTSLPFLLAPGLHHIEAFSEAVAAGAWGHHGGRLVERVRQAIDLEHWAAFHDAFTTVASMVLEVARGERGRPPTTITFLSGDVHHSYLSEAWPAEDATPTPGRSRILQAVCSPMRNPLPRPMRFATAALSYRATVPVGRLLARAAGVQPPRLRWRLAEGPWYDNTIATLEVTEAGLRLRWAAGVLPGSEHERPLLREVADVTLGTGDGS